MRKSQLTVLILGRLDVNLDLVADLQIRVVTELRNGDDTLALVADIDDHFALVDTDDRTFGHLVCGDVRKSLVISLADLLFGLVVNAQVVFKRVPVKVLVCNFFCFFHVEIKCDAIAR